jgi:hypothetical protein
VRQLNRAKAMSTFVVPSPWRFLHSSKCISCWVLFKPQSAAKPETPLPMIAMRSREMDFLAGLAELLCLVL